MNLYKDIVLVTRLRIFSTTLFTNNSIKVVIQMHSVQFDLLAWYHEKCKIKLELLLRLSISVYKSYIYVLSMIIVSLNTLLISRIHT